MTKQYQFISFSNQACNLLKKEATISKAILEITRDNLEDIFANKTW